MAGIRTGEPSGRDADLEELRVRMLKRIPFSAERGPREAAVDDLWAMYRLCREARDERDVLRDELRTARLAADAEADGLDGWQAAAERYKAERDALRAMLGGVGLVREHADAVEQRYRDLFDAVADLLRSVGPTEASHIGFGEARDCGDCPFGAAMDRLGDLTRGEP